MNKHELSTQILDIVQRHSLGWHTFNMRHYAICDSQETAHDVLDVQKGRYWEHFITVIFYPLLDKVELDAVYCSCCNSNGAFSGNDGSFSYCIECDSNKLLDCGSIDSVFIYKDENTKQSWVNKIRRDCYHNQIDDVIEMKLPTIIN